MLVRRPGSTAAALLLLGLLTGCGDDPAPAPAATELPGADALQIRKVLLSPYDVERYAAEARPDLRRAYTALSCEFASPRPVPAEEQMLACDAQGHAYLLGPAEIVGGVTEATVVDSRYPDLRLELDEETEEAFADLTEETSASGDVIATVVGGHLLLAATVESRMTGLPDLHVEDSALGQELVEELHG